MGKNKLKSNQAFLIILSTILGIVFLISFANKVVDINGFAYVISNYPFVIDDQFSVLLAIFILFWEGLIVLGLILFPLRNVFKISLVLFLCFSIALISLIVANEFFECGCGLFYKISSPKFSLGFDLVMIILLWEGLSRLKQKHKVKYIDLFIASSKRIT